MEDEEDAQRNVAQTLLGAKGEKYGTNKDNPKTDSISSVTPPHMVLLGKVDWGLIGNISFLFGSLLYVATALNLEVLCGWDLEDWPRTCSILNFLAALNFVFDAIFYMIDWYLLKYNPERNVKTVNVHFFSYSARIKAILNLLIKVDLRFWGDFLFLCGSLLYLLQACFYLWFPDINTWVAFAVDVTATLIFVVDSVVYLGSTILISRFLIPEGISKAWKCRYLPTDWARYDWDMVGDIFFIFGSIMYFIASFLCNISSDTYYECEWLLLLAAVNFVFDAVAYIIGYMIFYAGLDPLSDIRPVPVSLRDLSHV